MNRWLPKSLLILLLIANNRIHAQSSNTADLYRAAAKAVETPTDANEKQVLANVLTAPLDESARKVDDQGRKAVELFDAASKMPFDQWGFDTDDLTSIGRTIQGATDLADR